MRTLRKTVRLAVLAAVSIVVFYWALNPAKKSMDISDLIEKRGDLENFINENFDSVEYEEPFSPIPFYRVHLINRAALTFCTMNVQQCWVKKGNNLYAFFILIKRSAETEKHISKRYGLWQTSAEISIQGDRPGGELLSWSAGQWKMDLSSYINMLRDPKYEMCDLVVCRNMTYQQLMEDPIQETN